MGEQGKTWEGEAAGFSTIPLSGRQGTYGSSGALGQEFLNTDDFQTCHFAPRYPEAPRRMRML